MSTSKVIKRTACDRCRSKRVRCPRTESITVPCSRCIQADAQCITGNPGNPGRPRRVRNIANKPPGDSSASPTDFLTPHDDHLAYLHSPKTQLNNSLDFWTGSEEPNLLDLQFLSGFIPHSTPNPVEEASRRPEQESFSMASNLFFTQAKAMNIWNSNTSILEPYGSLTSPVTISRQSAAKMLVQFQERMEQQNVAIAELFSNPRNVFQDCKADVSSNMEDDNPIASIVSSTQKIIGTVQTLKEQSSSASSNSVSGNRHVSSNAGDYLSSETILLIIASYLSLMKLYESLFHGVYNCFCKVPPEAIKAIKVKGVLRIGGISSLQDVSVHSYATGIIDVLRAQIRALECCIGLPETYCLSNEAGPKKSGTDGLFARPDRRKLLSIAMEQEDVKLYRNNKSCVQSIRQNMESSLAFFSP